MEPIWEKKRLGEEAARAERFRVCHFLADAEYSV